MQGANGDTYTGQWREGNYHGTGRQETGPHVYQGEFKDGVPHGTGRFTLADGWTEGPVGRGSVGLTCADLIPVPSIGSARRAGE